MLSLTRKPGDDINCYHPDGSRLIIHLEQAFYDYIYLRLNGQNGILLDENSPTTSFDLSGSTIQIYLIRIRCAKYVQLGIRADKSIKIIRGEIDKIWEGYVNKL